MARALVLLLLISASLGAQQPRAGTSAHSSSTLVVAQFRESNDGFSQFSGIPDSVRVVIRDSVAWHRYWSAIHRPFIPAPAAPEVDFSREMVLLATLGSQPSAGYAIKIESAVADSARVLVQVRRIAPGTGCALAAVVTQPVDLVRVPSSTLPVMFAERLERLDCPGRPAPDRN
jgi:hypothetical protein